MRRRVRRGALLTAAFLVCATPAALAAPAQSTADVDVETRSSRWGLVVVLGLALTAALAAYSVRALRRALPPGTAVPGRQLVRANAPALAVGGALLVGAAVFAVAKMPDALDVQVTVAAEDVDGSSGDPGVSTDDDGTTGVAGSPGATVPGTGADPGRATTGTGGAAPSVPVVDVGLFDDASDRIGITADTIRLCAHAPLSLGAILNSKPEDVLVYWRWLNDRGGIHGRRVDMALEDDQYSASGAVPAAQRCAEREPFLLIGTIGSDTIAPVREWAERNKVLYLHGFAVRAGSEGLRYSYTATITQEDLTRVLADIALTKFPGQDIGVLWRNSSNVEPGHDSFRAQVERFGGRIVADLPVQKSQGNYTQEIIELQQRGAEVVVVLDDALAQTNVLLQASSQGYQPHWVIFGFNLMTDSLGDRALDPVLHGANLAPAYSHGDYSGPFAPYADELRQFEAAYAKYSPDTDLAGPLGDIAWQSWLGFKAIADLLDVCGPDCTRDRFAGMLEAGYVGRPGPACTADFRGDGHHGGASADLYETYRRADGAAGWRTYQRCAVPR